MIRTTHIWKKGLLIALMISWLYIASSTLQSTSSDVLKFAVLGGVLAVTHLRFWNEFLLTLEESPAAFSGIDPDLIVAPATIPKTCHGDGSGSGYSVRTSVLCTRGRDSKTVNRGR